MLTLFSFAICSVTDFKEFIYETYKDTVNDLLEDDYGDAKSKDTENVKLTSGISKNSFHHNQGWS